MSFNQANFATVGAHSADTPSIYSYSTTDSLATVIAADYFKPKEFQLSENDWIFAVVGGNNAILQVQADSSTALISNVFIDSPAYAEFHLTTTPEVIALNDDGVTFTKIPNMVLNLGSQFTVSSGTLTYNGLSGKFLINGTSDLEVNKAADVTYALVVNGTPIPSELTTETFTSSGKKSNISITSIAQLNPADEIEIHIKGDGTLSLTATINKLDTTYLRIGNG